MPDLNAISMGFALALAGVLILGLTWLVLRALPRLKSSSIAQTNPPLPVKVNHHDEAVLLIQSGGRVAYLNQKARELFNLWDEPPNLERLARKARPSEAFLSLCASQGQSRFNLNGHLVDGTSYYAPSESGRAILVSLRPPPWQLEADSSAENSGVSHAFNTLTELNQKISASLDLERTLEAILEGVEHLIPFDIAEINIWNPGKGHLVPYRYASAPGSEHRLSQAAEHYKPGEGYTGYLFRQRTPLLINDVDTFHQVRPSVDLKRYPINSFIGVPLLMSNDMIGTLELASFKKDNFTQVDLGMLRVLAGQAAVAVHNAVVYEAEQKRVRELEGLSDLAKAVSAVLEPQDLYNQLLNSIAPLFSVEVLGFLIFNEERRILAAQSPFKGAPQDLLDDIWVELPANSQGAEIFQSMETIVSQDAPEDERIQALGLQHAARWTGIRQMVLAPLAAGGRSVGYLQLGDKLDGTPFDSDDLRLIAIIAGQAAPIIDNANLLKQSRLRAQRAETLRRIASLTGSNATLDEILKYTLLDLARLIQADMAGIFLLDPAAGELRLHKASLFGVEAESASRLSKIPIDDPQFPLTVTGGLKQFVSGEADKAKILPIYQPLVDGLKVKSVIDVPLVVREHGIGELMLATHRPNFFNQGDAVTAATAAGQVASAIEQSTLSSQTDESLRQRIDQLTALTRISREITNTLDLNTVMRRVFDELLRTTRADCGTLLLFELEEEANLPPRIALHLGDPPGENLHPLEMAVLERGETVMVEDFGLETGEGQGVEPAHPGIHSALVVPIAYQGQVAGLIHLHGRTARLFDETSRQISESLAIQAAIALGNANRYHEQVLRSELLNRRVETLSKLYESSQAIQTEDNLDTALEAIAYGIQSATPFEVVLISVYDQASQNLQRATGVGIPLATLAEMRARPQPWNSLLSLLEERFKLGQAFFIPQEQTPVIPADPQTRTILEQDDSPQQAEDQWHADDTLLLPLYGTEEQILGLISVDAPRDSLRPDRLTLEALEIFGSQAAIAIENRLRQRALQEQLARAQSEGLKAQKLAKPGELEQIRRRAGRIQASLDIAEAVNRQRTRADVLFALGQGLLEQGEFGAAIIAEASQTRGYEREAELRSLEPRLVGTLGDINEETNPEALLGQRNPLRYSLLKGEPLFVSDLEQEEDWKSAPLLRALDAHAFICLPVNLNEQIEAAILVISRETLTTLTSEDKQLYALMARQAAIALQNLRLINQAQRRLAEVDSLLDFGRQLGSLDQKSILTALIESVQRALPNAQAAMVALWDERQRCLIPQAASGYPDVNRMLAIRFNPGEALPGRAFQQEQPILISEVDFARDYNLAPEGLLSYRDATAGRPPVSTLAVPILGSGRGAPLGVVIVDHFQEPGAFNAEDQALLTSLAQQTALTLENARLYQAAEERAQQLQALTRVATIITSSLKPEELVDSLLDQLQSILPYETGTLWLRQENRLVVQAARGFPDSEERIGLNVAIEDSQLLHEMITTGQPILVHDVRQDERFPAWAGYENLSWLGLPLIASGEVMGVVALEKREAQFYTPEHLQAAATFAGQASVSLENANLYQESVRRGEELHQQSQTLSRLNRLSTELSTSLDVETTLILAARELLKAVACDTVSAVLFTASGEGSVLAEYPQPGSRLPVLLPNIPLFERLRQSLGVYNSEEVDQDRELEGIEDFLTAHSTRSLLVLPLATGNDLHGFFLIHSHQLHRFDPEEVDLGRTISNQAAIAVQNARLFAETRSLTQDLEKRVAERTSELATEHQRTETLLRIITELSASLDLDQVLNRTLRVLNEVVDAKQITVLIARPGERKLHRLASVGYTVPALEDGSPTRFDTDQGLAGWVISSRKPALISDLLEDARWEPSEDPPLPEHRSALAVPLMIGAEALGCMLLLHPEVQHFSEEQLELVQAAGNQVAIAVNNAELYRLIRDQAEDLGSMLRQQQVETSRSKAILEAVADGVLVTDAARRITLFNASAEQILGLGRGQVLGKSLEHFTGLFGKAAQKWRETIDAWSQNPLNYEPGETFAERITLENGRVVSVHLAPVILRNDFLGTVSIFTDITHQVEVDRLKSEFVATVSHELRTPMTSIQGYAEILLMGAAGALSEQQQQFLDIIKMNTKRLSVLVNDLLDISRIESGRVTLNMQALDLAALSDEVMKELETRTRRDIKKITLQREIPSSLPRVRGDPERVRQIIHNLLDNAYLYNYPNGTITLRILPQDNYVQVDIQDSGIGVPPADRERIFERFFRGESPLILGVSGTGLGLSIVQNLVWMHEGKIWVESTGVPGKGSTFSFTLPIYTSAEGIEDEVLAMTGVGSAE
jgi:PAS domain S-box-containing protein